MTQTLWCVPLMLFCSYVLPPSVTEAVETNGEGVLTLIKASPRRLKGLYSTCSGGILFDVSVREGSHQSLSISTLDGKRVLDIKQHTSNLPMGISLFDNHFILSKVQDRVRHREYLVPRALHGYFEAALRRAKIMKLLRNQLDEETANVTCSAAIIELLASKEVYLVIEAAKAIGSRGITGSDSPAAMMLYILALSAQDLVDRLDKSLPDDRIRQHTTKHEQNVTIMGKSSASALEYCANSKFTCPVGECPVGNKCLGLCGPACHCWEWVCKSCCLTRMCYDHDVCCEKYGLFSWSCLGVIFMFSAGTLDCNAPYYCRKGSVQENI